MPPPHPPSAGSAGTLKVPVAVCVPDSATVELTDCILTAGVKAIEAPRQEQPPGCSCRFLLSKPLCPIVDAASPRVMSYRKPEPFTKPPPQYMISKKNWSPQ